MPLFINHLPQRVYSMVCGQCFSILSFNLIVTVTCDKNNRKSDNWDGSVCGSHGTLRQKLKI